MPERRSDFKVSTPEREVVRAEVRNTAGVAADTLPEQEVEIRGRAEPMLVRTVVNARVLAALVADESVVAA